MCQLKFYLMVNEGLIWALGHWIWALHFGLTANLTKFFLILGDEVSSSEDEFEKMMKAELNDKMAVHELTWMAGSRGNCDLTTVAACLIK